MNYAMKKSLRSLGLAAAFSMLGTSAFAGILKTPYLIYPGVTNAQGPANTQMEVLWQDNATEATNTLSWGTDTTYSMGSVTVPELSSTEVMPHQHMFTIAGLTPNTTYYYQVADATGGVYGSGSFITAPAESVTSIRFLGMGDSRSQPYALDSVMQAMHSFYSLPGNSDYQRLVIHNGDWVSSDGETYWTTQWFTGYSDIVNFTANTPINGVKGNHDNASGYSATFPKYYPFPYPNMTAKTTTPTADSNGNPYYNNLYWSYDYGPVHFTHVDEYSSFAAGSAQYTWLVNDLASTSKPWKILIYHEPAYSAGSDGDNTAVRALEPLVTMYNVDLIYCGHSHNYARTGAYTLSQANNDLIALNVPHITSGGGGAPVYQPDMTNNNSYPHVITAWPAFEFMSFDIEGKTMTMTAYQVNGVNTSALPTTTLNYTPIETVVVNHFTNVSPQVTATVGNLVYNRATKLYTGNLTITNNGAPLTGNVDVVLDNILDLSQIGAADNQYSTATPKLASKIANQPATAGTHGTDPGLMTTVTLVNQTGTNNGEPMIRATASGLGNGASVTVPLTFSNPTGAKITFNPRTYQE